MPEFDEELISKIAESFHWIYEYFAKMNNWKTNKKCRNVRFEDLPPANKKTMIDTIKEIFKIYNLKSEEL